MRAKQKRATKTTVIVVEKNLNEKWITVKKAQNAETN